MMKIEAIIFDMDGTLYSFDDEDESKFTSSLFGKTIRANSVRFFQERCALGLEAAELQYRDLSDRFNGEVSLAVEKEYGIDRSEYFAFTWNIPVADFIQPNKGLVTTLQSLSVKSGLLTAAPKVWAESVLDFLQVRDIFGEALFTGDPDIRKPNPLAFQQLADLWKLEPEYILSIGDQEATDILPAKSLGMQTLRIARNAQSQADFVAPDVSTALKLLQQKGVL